MLKAKSSSPFANFSLSSLKNPKFLAIFLLLFILAGLPVALYEVQQQQTVNQHAAFFKGEQTYYCNSNLTVILSPVSENPSACSTGSYSGVSSYVSSIKLAAKSGSSGSYTLHWNWGTFFCPTENSGPCLSNPIGTERTASFNGSSSLTLTSDKRTAIAPFSGQACGYYQNDFGFYITDSSGKKMCTSIVNLSAVSLGVLNNNASWCHSGKTCATILPSPTPTFTPTPSPTGVIPTDSPTPTLPISTPTATPTVTPTATPSATETPTLTPTGTLTPTATPTITPTGNPTATPPGTTPVPTVIVAKPTLPPTGPNNTFVAIGLVGVAISVLGMALLLGL